MNVFSRIKLLLELQSALGKFQKAWENFLKDKSMNTLTLGQTLKSKTFWVNIITGAGVVYSNIQGLLPPSANELIAAGLALTNVILKVFFTKQVPQQ